MRHPENGQWIESRQSVRVLPNTDFKVWISLDTTVDDGYLFSLAALKDVGEIKIELKQGGTRAERSFKI